MEASHPRSVRWRRALALTLALPVVMTIVGATLRADSADAKTGSAVPLTKTVNVDADTYVSTREPNRGHGGRPYVYATTDETYGYLAFNTRGLVPAGFTVSSVSLRMYVTENNLSSGTPVVSRSSYTWNEKLTTLGGKVKSTHDSLSAAVTAKAQSWVTIPLQTRALEKNGYSAFEVSYSQWYSNFRFASREGGRPAQLVVKVVPTRSGSKFRNYVARSTLPKSTVTPSTASSTPSAVKSSTPSATTPTPSSTTPTTATTTPTPTPQSSSSNPSAPTAASGGGFSDLAFNEEFESLGGVDLTGKGTATKNFYTDRPFSYGQVPASTMSVNNGVLTFSQEKETANLGISSISAATGKGQTFRYGYFEARMKFDERNATKSAGWPSFWMLPKAKIYGSTITDYPELDIFEAYHEPYAASTHSFVGSVHDWHIGSKPTVHRSNAGNSICPLKQSVDLNEFHTYGVLWTQGKVVWYFDGQPVLTQEYGANQSPSPNHGGLPQGTFSMLDQQDQGMALILGTGVNYPMQVDWVRAWS